MARLLEHDSEAVQMTASMIDPMTEETARDWIERRTNSDQQVFAILLKSPAQFVGSIGLGGLQEIPYVGYWLGRPYWGQGYATEALLGLIEYARWRGIPALQADTFPNNPASARILAKVGFIHTGLIQLNIPLRGGLREANHHELRL
jgi:RimJ/RimL family protein N-acetyltransferase